MRRNSTTHYIKGIDGLRALAILAVLGYHLLPRVFPGGYIGVDIFFVISGFLITSLLITEWARTGSIHLRKFWTRRARRLLPALLVTIGVISATALFVRGDILVSIGRQILGALTFSNNWVEIAAGANYFDSTTTHLFTNFWSLAVEEQFYVVWPFVVLLLVGVPWMVRHSKTAVLVSLLIAMVSIVLMATMFEGTNATRVYYGTDTHLFGLMIGAALAFWNRSKTKQYALRRLSRPFWWLADKKGVQVLGMLALIGLVILMVTMPDSSSLTYTGGLASVSVLAAMVIIAVTGKGGMVQQIFTWHPLEWTGVRSYGIYLWHWPLLVLFGHALPTTVSQWIAPVLALVASFVCAALSYRYIEAPILQSGFRAVLERSIKRKTADSSARSLWRLAPHAGLIASPLVIGLAIGAVISAPSKTQAQLRVEAGQQAIRQARTASSPGPKTQAVAGAQTSKHTPVTGDDITVVGDSVSLAAAPALQQRFPGILINAEVSRSMRRGGLETIENLDAAGSLRKVVVVALATNGYFGADNLERVVSELGDRRIVFVTAHVDREWTIPNNDDLHKLASEHSNVTVAEWDAAISPHPEDLSGDGIHPSVQGGLIYTDAIARALGQ